MLFSEYLKDFNVKVFLPLKISAIYFTFTVFQSLFIEASDGELTTEFLEVGTVGALPGLSPLPAQHRYIKWEGKEEYYFCQSRKCQKDPSSKFMWMFQSIKFGACGSSYRVAEVRILSGDKF